MNKVVVGAQWGDEGKAKITDLLAGDADLIIRYQGVATPVTQLLRITKHSNSTLFHQEFYIKAKLVLSELERLFCRNILKKKFKD